MRAAGQATVIAVALIAGCGEKDAAQMDGASCDDECVLGWWTAVQFSSCAGLCPAMPDAPECAEPDCEHLEGRLLAADATALRLDLVHSPARRSMTLFAITERTWTIEAPCLLVIGEGTGMTFSCVGEDVLDLPGRGLVAASDRNARGARESGRRGQRVPPLLLSVARLGLACRKRGGRRTSPLHLLRERTRSRLWGG
jgi:hypothetical protein